MTRRAGMAARYRLLGRRFDFFGVAFRGTWHEHTHEIERPQSSASNPTHLVCFLSAQASDMPGYEEDSGARPGHSHVRRASVSPRVLLPGDHPRDLGIAARCRGAQ